jgi:gluconokinase
MIFILFGVSGCGKSTIAAALATANRWQYVDADDYHSEANKAKMADPDSGGLNDADRLPWLQTLHQEILLWLDTNQHTVLACSALKRSYRDLLSANHPDVQFVYLNGSYELIYERLIKRQNHFATEKLLKSQFKTLEMPLPTETIQVEIDQDIAMIVDAINQAVSAE